MKNRTLGKTDDIQTRFMAELIRLYQYQFAVLDGSIMIT